MKRIFTLIILGLLLAACAQANPLALTNTAPPPPNPETHATATATQPGGTPQTNQSSGASIASAPTPAAQAQASQGIPNFDHIILIVLENRDYTTALDNMPHLKDLADQNVLLSNYFAASHPSLPNYIALVSGSTQNITSDCTNCFVSQPNLADEIDASGRTWKAYLESMPSPCFLGDADPYAQKHNPFLYFDSIRLNVNLCDKTIVPLTQLDNDLNSKQLPNFSFIMPNLCNSGHDCKPSKADKWVNDMVKKLQGSDALGEKNLIIVTFDEASGGNTASCCGLGKGGGRVATILLSPQAKSGFVDNTAYSHYSLLKTILVAWNLPSLGKTNESTIEPIMAPWSENK